MNKRILLVDDNRNLLKGIERTLEDLPFKVFTANNVEEAKSVLQATSIDVVVSDYRMPGESGVELLIWVAEYCPSVQRILLTGQPDIPAVAKAVNEAKIYQFLQKPVTKSQLLESICASLQSQPLMV